MKTSPSRHYIALTHQVHFCTCQIHLFTPLNTHSWQFPQYTQANWTGCQIHFPMHWYPENITLFSFFELIKQEMCFFQVTICVDLPIIKKSQLWGQIFHEMAEHAPLTFYEVWNVLWTESDLFYMKVWEKLVHLLLSIKTQGHASGFTSFLGQLFQQHLSTTATLPLLFHLH